MTSCGIFIFFFFQAEDGIRDVAVTGVQTCALPILLALVRRATGLDARVSRGTFPSLHPGKTAALHVGERIVGYVGVVDPRLAHVYDVADTTALATLFVE